MIFQRPINIGFSPNTEKDDYLLAFKTLFASGKWQKGENVENIEDWFKKKFSAEEAVSFNAGRSALLAILETLGITKNDEVLIQAFTCVAVPNSILWAGASPLYVDIDETLNIDIKDAEKKITSKTKALIVQHTFGMPANMYAALAFCKKHKLFLIEDCAHALGATYDGKPVGTFGIASFFSFGRDKIVSSVFGGLAITQDKNVGLKLREYQEKLPSPSWFWILQQLLHPVISSVALSFYSIFSLGKILLFMAQKLQLLSFPVDTLEKKGKRPLFYPQKYPNALAILLERQLQKLDFYNHKRQKFAELYCKKLENGLDSFPKLEKGAVYLRFPLSTVRSDEMRFTGKKKGMLLGNWYSYTIDPKGVDFAKVRYTPGSCPVAERKAREIINLPTYPTLTMKQAEKVIQLILHNQETRTL